MIFKLLWFIRALIYMPFFGKIGWLTYIGSPICLHNTKKIFIGNKVRIFPHVRLEAHGKDAQLVIEDNVGIGQNVHITTGEKLIIGRSTTILANVFITNIDHNYENIGVPVLDQEMLVKTTKIGENCFIGIGAAIQAGTVLGKQCIVGANSVVRGTFPDFTVIAGVPAKVIKKYNFITERWEKVN